MRAVYEVQNSDNHKVLEALNFEDVKTWRKFMKMEDEDIEELTKSATSNASKRVPIATSSKRELVSFMRLITERSENNDPRARDISSYTAKDIEQYYYEHKKSLQLKAL